MYTYIHIIHVYMHWVMCCECVGFIRTYVCVPTYVYIYVCIRLCAVNAWGVYI